MLHDEVDGRTAFAAAETFADIAGLVDRERGSALVVERAQSLVVGAGAAQLHKVAYDIYYIGGVEDTLHGFLINSCHCKCKFTKN